MSLKIPILLLSLVSCGGVAHRPVEGNAETARSSAGMPVATPRVVRRSEVKATLDAGLGAFLQTIELDEHPVYEAGHFHGFRIVDLAPAWQAAGLRRGDVVMSVNGHSIERPEQAVDAFRSIGTANAIVVSYERDGILNQIKYAIIDDPH